MRAYAYTKKLALVILITCHTNISVSWIEKNYWFSPGFIKNFNFDNELLDQTTIPINAKHYGHQRSKINWIFQRDFFHFNFTADNKQWISGLRYFTLGWWTAKTKVCFDITIKSDKIFVNALFWNFDITGKKSADFSCLFTFFQKIYKFKNNYGTIWELHTFQIKYDICLHFCNIRDLCYNSKM